MTAKTGWETRVSGGEPDRKKVPPSPPASGHACVRTNRRDDDTFFCGDSRAGVRGRVGVREVWQKRRQSRRTPKRRSAVICAGGKKVEIEERSLGAAERRPRLCRDDNLNRSEKQLRVIALIAALG